VTLTLAVETSSFTYDVALVAGDGEIIARRSVRLRSPEFRSIGYLVESMMRGAERDFDTIDRLAVDVGPGNVISVRAGISYVNGLAFSMRKPVLSVDSLTLLAAQTGATGDVVCIRNAGGGNVNAALFRDGRRVAGRHGQLAEVTAALLDGIDEVTLAGAFRDLVEPIVPGVRLRDSGVEFPSVATLCRVIQASDVAVIGDYATPITDASSNSTSVHPL
jgi:tRNA threonylcarbamoyl adenosine modification protein YeaZ